MNVGDGTWDSSRNTFLLPNLAGLNFETMRYNGMGNRFASFDGYHSLIIAHGSLAAITFLFIVPTAILYARFYQRNPYLALRIHIMLQSLTIALVVTVFILGYMAVGPARSLTNPHHGIGVAIFTLVLLQALGGWLVHRRAKGRIAVRTRFTAMVHHWSGRLIALLGIIQIALGLTLYGSPLYLFVLYTLAVAVLIIIYFMISWRSGGRPTQIFNEGGQVIIERPEGRHYGLGKLAAVAAAGTGLAAFATQRHRGRSLSPSGRGSRPPTVISDSHASYASDEKSGYYATRRSWRDKLLGLGAAAGAGGLAARLLRKDRDDRSELESRPDTSALAGTEVYSPVNQNSPGGTPVRPPTGRLLHHRNASYESAHASSYSDERQKSRLGWKEGLLGIGVIAGIRELYRGRQARKEQRRADEIRRVDVDEELVARAESNRGRFTGDGVPRPPRMSGLNPRAGSTSNLPAPPNIADEMDATVYSGSPSSVGPEHSAPISRLGIGGRAAAAASAAAAKNAEEVEKDRREEQERLRAQVLPPLVAPSVPHGMQNDGISPSSESSRNSLSSSDDRTEQRRSRIGSSVGAAVAGGAAGAILGAAISGHRANSRSREEGVRVEEQQRTEDSTDLDPDAPTVSMNVRHNPDGRTLTINRNPEQERAARRETRRLQRQQTGMPGGHSGSSLAQSSQNLGYTSPTRPPILQQPVPTIPIQTQQPHLAFGSQVTTPPHHRPYNSPSQSYTQNASSHGPYNHQNMFSQQRLNSPPTSNRFGSPSGLLSPARSAVPLQPPQPVAGYMSPGGMSSPGSQRPGTAGTGATGTGFGLTSGSERDYYENKRRRQAERAKTGRQAVGGPRANVQASERSRS